MKLKGNAREGGMLRREADGGQANFAMNWLINLITTRYKPTELGRESPPFRSAQHRRA